MQLSYEINILESCKQTSKWQKERTRNNVKAIKLRSRKEIPYRGGEIKEHINNHSAIIERRKMLDERSWLEHKNGECR